MTEREQLLTAQALAFAILALEELPDDRRPDSNIQDMKQMFDGFIRYRDIAQGQANAWHGLLFRTDDD